MRRSLPPRWRAPAILTVAAVIAVLTGGIAHGWSTVPKILPIPLAVLGFLYATSGRDTDYGAFLRRQLDERQQLLRLKIQALMGRGLSIAVLVAYIVALATKAMLWPWAALVGLIVVMFVAGRLIYGDRSSGQDLT